MRGELGDQGSPAIGVVGKGSFLGLFAGVVDEAGDFAAEFFAVDNAVEEAFLQEELGALEALGEFLSDGV